MSVNLNEFTAEQLEFAIQAFKEKQNDVNYKISALDMMDDESILKEALLLGFQADLDTAILFRIQLENALAEVRAMDKLLSH